MNIFAFWKESSGGNKEDRLEIKKFTKDVIEDSRDGFELSQW